MWLLFRNILITGDDLFKTVKYQFYISVYCFNCLQFFMINEQNLNYFINYTLQAL